MLPPDLDAKSRVRLVGSESCVAAPMNNVAPEWSYTPKGMREQAAALLKAPSVTSRISATKAPRRMARALCPCRALVNDRDRESVVALTPDSLKSGCGDTRLQREPLIQTADALHTRILAVRVNHSAFSDDVVHDDDAS